MILDYVEKTRAFTLRVQRGEGDPMALVKSHGLDFSIPASTPSSAVLFTRDPYAAACFAECATPTAMGRISSIVEQVKLSWKDSSNAIIRCPADRQLWPFQIADVEYALGRKNTLVGDQPGLGKTPVAICFANEIRAKRVLVICPANIRLQWARKVREWSTMPWPYVVYSILNGGRGVHPTAEWTIVSYDLARSPQIGAALARGQYDLLILDEAHFLKTIDTRRTRAVFGDHTGDYREPIRHEITQEILNYEVLFTALASRCDRILALTGTPLPNRPREAYTLARGLCFDAIDWMSEDSFRDRFNPSARIEGQRSDGSTFTYTREEAGRHGELNNRLRANFMVRHLKHGPNGVMKHLKLPVYDIVLVDETSAVKAAIKAESMLAIDHTDPQFFKHANDTVLGQIAAVRRQMGVAKAPLVAGYAEMVLEGGEDKLCVFAWHIEVLNIIERQLKKYGLMRIDGSVSPRKRQMLVDDFIANPKTRVCLGNIQSVGTGTDGLHKVCSHAVIGEPSWVDGENQQLVDRLDRGDQQRTVLADFLVAPGSIDERVLSSALRKGKETTKVLDN